MKLEFLGGIFEHVQSALCGILCGIFSHFHPYCISKGWGHLYYSCTNIYQWEAHTDGKMYAMQKAYMSYIRVLQGRI